MTTALPEALRGTVERDGRPIAKIMLDLTLYLEGPSRDDFETLFDLVEARLPPSLTRRYKVAEQAMWFDTAQPELTASGRAAAARGEARPYFAPARRRIDEGRALEAGWWDGLELGDPAGSYSLVCRRILRRASGLHAFARVLCPVDVDPQVLRGIAAESADRIALRSGHGGLAFVYDPRHKGAALDAGYAWARRYWGIDLEDLNATLPSMREAIKGVNWLTLVGRGFRERPDVARSLEALERERLPLLAIENRRHASLLVAGPMPVAGDRHRANGGLDAYIAVAAALRSLFPDALPDFECERFIDNGNTLGWVRRFIEPVGWR